jgi:hypothetical protein
MNTNIIEEACANIASISSTIEEYCNDPKNRCSPCAANLLERMAWELQRNANELKEINYLYVS